MSWRGKRSGPVVAGSAAVLLLLGAAGLWHRAHAALPVVWKLSAPASLKGRRDPAWLVRLHREPGEVTVLVMRPFSPSWAHWGRWLGLDAQYMGSGGYRAAVVPGGPDAFLVMDEEDRVYGGFSNGEIRRWNLEDESADEKPVVVTGAERARVAAMYLKKMGKAWPEPQEQAR